MGLGEVFKTKDLLHLPSPTGLERPGVGEGRTGVMAASRGLFPRRPPLGSVRSHIKMEGWPYKENIPK